MGISEQDQHILRTAAERLDVKQVPALLGTAFTYCAQAFSSSALAAHPRVELLAMLAELGAVLQRGRDSLAVITETAQKQVFAGPRLREALHEGDAAIAQCAHDLAQLYEACAPLLQQEKILQQQVTDYESLQHRYEELSRLAALTGQKEELSAQVTALAQRLACTDQDVAAWEQAIEEKAQSLITLSTATLAHLQPRVRQALEEAERLQQSCCKARQQLHEAQQEAHQADANWQKLTSELRPHLEANQAVASALPQNTAPHTLLDEAERLLRQADDALRDALKTQADTQRLVKVPFVERNNGHAG